jgi:outer membrane protein assembly factor BamB
LHELHYRLLGGDEKTWQKKLFFREVGRPGNPDSAFVLLLASARRSGEGGPVESLGLELFSRLAGHYSLGHLTNSPREMVRQLVEIVSAEGSKIRESRIDLAAGFVFVKGRQAAAGSIGRLRAGFANQNRIVASSPLISGKGRSVEDQVSLDLGQTVEGDLDELPAFFIAPSGATAVGEEPMRKFLWDFVSDETGIGDKAPSGWEHLPCLVGYADEPSEKVVHIEPERPAEPIGPMASETEAPSRSALYWIGGIAAVAVVAVTTAILMTRGPQVPRETSIPTHAIAAGQDASDEEELHPSREAEIITAGESVEASGGESPGTEAGGPARPGPALSLLWRKSLGEVLTSSPADIGDALAFGSRGGVVHCLSKSDGSRRWSFKGPDGFGSSPAEWSGRLYIGCYDGNIFCLSAGDGSERWRYRTGGKIVCTPLVTDGGRVLVGSFDGVLYCLSADGDLLWDFNAGSRIWASPEATGSAVLVGDLGGRINCLDLNTGRPRWGKTVGGEIYGSPVLGDGVVYFGSSNGRVIALSAADGGEKWRYSRNGSVSSSLAIGGEVLLAGFDDKTLVALARADGKVLWETAMPGAARSRPVVSGRAAAVTCYDGSVVLIDISTGSILASFSDAGSVYATPVVADGVVYFGDMKGDFMALSATGITSE